MHVFKLIHTPTASHGSAKHGLQATAAHCLGLSVSFTEEADCPHTVHAAFVLRWQN